MRVTLLTTSFPVAGSSVSGIFVARLVDSLVNDVDLTVVTPAVRNTIGWHKRGNATLFMFPYAPNHHWQVLAHRAGGIPVALKNNKWLLALVPLFLVSMLLACVRNARRSDLIHANWAICGLVGGLAGLLLRKPVISTLRGEDITKARVSLLSRMVVRLCLSLSTRVIAVSEAIFCWLKTVFPHHIDKFSLIENGISDSFFALKLERRHEESRTPLRLLTVGSLIPRKATNVIIRAMSLLDTSQIVRLSIVGTGPEEECLRRLVKKSGLENYVEFLGEVEPEALAEIYAKASIFVHASHSEGRPNAILEAMAAGHAVVGSKIEGITELIEHKKNGLLFDPGDSSQLADCILKLCTQPDLRRSLGDAAREFVRKKNLTWDAAAKRYIDLYNSILLEANK